MSLGLHMVVVMFFALMAGADALTLLMLRHLTSPVKMGNALGPLYLSLGLSIIACFYYTLTLRQRLTE